jgi:hypothetical protein
LLNDYLWHVHYELPNKPNCNNISLGVRQGGCVNKIRKKGVFKCFLFVSSVLPPKTAVPAQAWQQLLSFCPPPPHSMTQVRDLVADLAKAVKTSSK